MLKNDLQFNVSEGSLSSINTITLDVFWPCNSWQGWEWNCPHHTSFSTKNCYLLNWNLAHMLSNLKTFWIWCDTFYWSHHILGFSARKVSFTIFSSIFSLLLAFTEFQFPFYRKTFDLIFTMRIFYFVLLWRVLKYIKLKNIFFYPSATNLQY